MSLLWKSNKSATLQIWGTLHYKISEVIHYLLCYFQTFKTSKTIFFVWKLPLSEGGSNSKQIQ